MKHFRCIPIALLGCLLCGCAMPHVEPFMPPGAAVVTQVKAPLTLDFDSTPVGSKKGRASTFYIALPVPYLAPFLTFAFKECSIEAAAKNGGITKVGYADYEYLNVLGLFGQMTVIAHGE